MSINSTQRCCAFLLVSLFIADSEVQIHAAESSQVPVDFSRIQGVLSVVSGDPVPWGSGADVKGYFLQVDNQITTEVFLAEDLVRTVGGVDRLDGRRVELVIGSDRREAEDQLLKRKPIVHSIRILSDETQSKASKAVSGSRPWVSVLCKFSDISTEPHSLSYFQNMYATTYPGLDHYWREVSYNIANVTGSVAVAWVNLPHPRSHYESEGTQSGYDLNALAADCTAAADPYVYFPNFVGINMMFNATFGPYAWGGSRYFSLDGVSRRYSVTWEPPWGYEDICVIAHEMGHGFGLPHSNNADGDSDPYDNPWDVMSNSWGYALYDSTYETLGKHTIAYHKDMLGWIDADKKLDISSQGIYQAKLDHLTLQSTSNLRLVTIQIPSSSSFYTLEVRDQQDYDGNLPGFAVVIHEVDTTRKEDAWLVDPVAPSNGADEGAMWRVGECFEDEPNEIEVCVQAVTTEGFEVQISYGDVGSIFDDGFESGSTTIWSEVLP
jgi:M6 family metalloprotease-like protein